MKKYIGTGAWGIIIPNVYGATGGQSSAEYALSVTKYPPQGIRRAGAERATGYLARFSEYVKVANNLMLTVLMMETPEAADDIEEWVKLPGLDVVHMGPYDLSLRMNVSMDSTELREKLRRVEDVCRNAGIPLGGAANTLQEAHDMFDRGYRFFTVPGDMQLLQNGIKDWFGNDADLEFAISPLRRETGNAGLSAGGIAGIHYV